MSIHDEAPPGVRLVGLTKSYGPVKAVRGIDLTIGAGQTVALLGPNGAGKSTTIDAMLGLSRPDAGTVEIFGRGAADAIRAGLVGAMLQSGQQPEYLRVREVVELTASYYPNPRPVQEVLELTGVAEFADRWATRLSGGQSQLVRFAAALVGDPDLLVLDEPTAAVDVAGRNDFWRVMREVAQQGKTIVFATHYLEEADAFADRIVLLARGRIVADGPATEIKALAGTRTIRATLPGVETERLATLEGVASVQRHGDTVILSCTDADTALRALLSGYAAARDLEVRGGSLEEAFLELTDDSEDGVSATPEAVIQTETAGVNS
ncbi:MAG: ABC transporter ATP-binding protein [Catenulispora sp.]|nr:ABC transporter ATP-binding protein [Catenulispora sp.]